MISGIGARLALLAVFFARAFFLAADLLVTAATVVLAAGSTAGTAGLSRSIAARACVQPKLATNNAVAAANTTPTNFRDIPCRQPSHHPPPSYRLRVKGLFTLMRGNPAIQRLIMGKFHMWPGAYGYLLHYLEDFDSPRERADGGSRRGYSRPR